MRLIFLVLATAVAGAHAADVHTPEAKADEVTGLPGWAGSLPSKWFSGMLPIGADMFSHYIYVQREVWVWVNYIVRVQFLRSDMLSSLYPCDVGIKSYCF